MSDLTCMQVLTGNGRVKELGACADAGYLLENSMHDSSRDADDGLMCSMYDVLRLYVILNQLLHNEWDVLECLQWPSDEGLPEAAQGLLNAKSNGIKTQGRRADRFAAMPPEPLMKLIIGSQLHWVASITAGLEGGEGFDAAANESVKPQFARNQAWLEMGRSVREMTVTNEDVRAFCEEQLLPTLVTTEYMLAYDRRCALMTFLPMLSFCVCDPDALLFLVLFALPSGCLLKPGAFPLMSFLVLVCNMFVPAGGARGPCLFQWARTTGRSL